MSLKIDKSKIDVSAVFLVFVAVLGDIDRTALAMDISPEVVRALAEQENWIQKVKKVSLMSKSEVPGQYEKAVNRGIMFLQAHTLRSVIQRILDVMSKQEGQELINTLAQVKAGTTTYSAKFLADMAQAMERANYMSLVALGDTVPERETEKEISGGEMNTAALHAAVLTALSSPMAAGAERHILEQNVEDLVRANIPKKPTE